MKLWKVWIESVRHLADCGREPGCHFTPGCIGNRAHCPFSSRIWWIWFCQSMNPSFRSRSRLNSSMTDCQRIWWDPNSSENSESRLLEDLVMLELMRIWCIKVCHFEILAWMFCDDLLVYCSWWELGLWNRGCKVSSSAWFRLPPLCLYSLTSLDSTLLQCTL